MKFKSKKIIYDKSIEMFTPRNNGEISNSIIQNWTDQAIMCYQNNCNCMNCSIASGNYSFVCQMPKVVKLLLEQIGPPDVGKVKKILA